MFLYKLLSDSFCHDLKTLRRKVGTVKKSEIVWTIFVNDTHSFYRSDLYQ